MTLPPTMIKVPTNHALKERARAAAQSQGTTLAGLVRRVLTIYLRHQAEFERLFQELRAAEAGATERGGGYGGSRARPRL